MPVPAWNAMPSRKGRGYQKMPGGYVPEIGLYAKGCYFIFPFMYLLLLTYIVLFFKDMSYVLL